MPTTHEPTREGNSPAGAGFRVGEQEEAGTEGAPSALAYVLVLGPCGQVVLCRRLRTTAAIHECERVLGFPVPADGATLLPVHIASRSQLTEWLQVAGQLEAP